MNAPVKILLVEDSASDADVLQEMLLQTGMGRFEFVWVERLEEALARLRQEAFDVLLLDLSLPDSAGPNTFLRAQEAEPRVPIVVLTGAEDERLGLEAVRHGVQDYLVKGRVDGPQVARAIRYAIERQRAEMELQRSTDRFKLLSDVAGQLLEAEDPQVVVNELCADVMRHLDCQVFFNYLVVEAPDRSGTHERSDGTVTGSAPGMGRLWLNAYAGIPAEEAGKIAWLDYGVAVCGCVARDGCRMVAEDIDHAADPRTDRVRSYGIRAYACHPLMAGKSVIGTLSFGTRTRARFTPDELALMKTVADQVAIAMERLWSAREIARLNQGLQNRLAELETILNTVPVGVAIAEDATGRHIRGNRTNEEMFGLPPGAELSKAGPDAARFRVFQEGRELALTELPMQRAVRGETVSGMVMDGLREDGSTFTVYGSSAPLFDETGRPRGAVGAFLDITPLKQAERALRRAKEEWERTFDAVPDMIAIMDDGQRILRANRAMATRLGCAPEQCIGQLCYTCVHDTAAPPEFCPHLLMLADGHSHVAEIHEERLGGDFVVSTTPLVDERGERVGVVHVARDVTELKKREQELHKLNRTLQALSRSNQVLMRAENETDFLYEACRIIVEDCGHAMVWIGYAEQDAAKTVRPVAHAGFEEGYLETLKLTWADTERGRGPTGTAIRTGKPCVCADMLADPRFAPWREEALKRGYASSVVLPLLAEAKAFGAITIYFRQPGALSEDELRLLTELADDVAYGVAAIRLRQAHALAEAALRASEERLATFAAATFEGLVLSEGGRIVDCNGQFAQMAGYTIQELRGVAIRDLIVPEDRERVVENILQGRDSVTEHAMVRKDGTRVIVEAHGRALSRTDPRRHTSIRDITARKQVEEALRQARDLLEQRVAERTAELRTANEELTRVLAEQRRLEAEVLEISHRERQRIGQDLHDGLTQHLNGILYLGETLRQQLAQQMKLDPAELDRLTDLLSDAVNQARDLAHGLNPVSTEPDGLILALKHFAAMVRGTFRISCRLESHGPVLLEDNAVATHLYRIAQEAVQNAIKHGKATRVRMRLREVENLITFEVRDNGVGLSNLSNNRSGMGLHIMQYRAGACGGQFTLRPGPRGGAWVICSVPRPAARQKRTTP